jgi:hypothetical protein
MHLVSVSDDHVITSRSSVLLDGSAYQTAPRAMHVQSSSWMLPWCYGLRVNHLERQIDFSPKQYSPAMQIYTW